MLIDAIALGITGMNSNRTGEYVVAFLFLVFAGITSSIYFENSRPDKGLARSFLVPFKKTW